ncbi:beta-lactamase superfamily domain-containing protein [Russula dissimulans]|nr:beta-lactamase superfamily domain-containing protein [Russula dissimulans]
MRPTHHVISSRTLFQNPWTVSESNAAPPSDQTQYTSTYWPASLAKRVRESEFHPHPPVKVVKPDWGHSKTPSPEPNVKATWLGHASFLVEFPCVGSGPDDKPPRVLFDPIFSDCAGPLPWIGVRRRLPPPCTVAELPEFQYVVYSHNHYDHLDLPTLLQIHELYAGRVHFLVPLGNKKWFEECEIPSSQVTELDWWDHIMLSTQPDSSQQLKFVCTPAQHKSGRGFMDGWTTLWASWVVELALPSTTGKDRASVYFAGDTGYMTTDGPCPIFKEIGSKYGPFDIAMLPIWRGGTLSFISRLGFRLMHSSDSVNTAFHATPAQALRMHSALRSRHSLAMHFATFAGSDVEAFDPIVALEQAKREMARGRVLRQAMQRLGEWMGTRVEQSRRRPWAIGAEQVGETEPPVTVGNWWMEGGMGVTDVGETAVVLVGENSRGIRRDNLTDVAE